MDFEAIKTAMAELEEDTLMEYIVQVAESGGDDVDAAMAAMQDGMKEVGVLFESGEYFVGDLIYAGEIMTAAMEALKPAMKGEGAEKTGKMILCTVKYDLHDIGKKIVKALLEAAGFEIVDLGIDTPPEKIVEAAKENDIHIIGLSGVLTLALDSMKATVEAFNQAGMRDSVKIIIGGAPVNEEACKKIGADEWAQSPQKTVDTCREWAKLY